MLGLGSSWAAPPPFLRVRFRRSLPRTMTSLGSSFTFSVSVSSSSGLARPRRPAARGGRRHCRLHRGSSCPSGGGLLSASRAGCAAPGAALTAGAVLPVASQLCIAPAAARLSPGGSRCIPGRDMVRPRSAGRHAAAAPAGACLVCPRSQHLVAPRFHALHHGHAGAPCCGHTRPPVNRPRASCRSAARAPAGGEPGGEYGIGLPCGLGFGGRAGGWGGGRSPGLRAPRLPLPGPQGLAPPHRDREIILQECHLPHPLLRWGPQPLLPPGHAVQREAL